MFKIISHNFIKGYLPKCFLPSCIILIQADQELFNAGKLNRIEKTVLEILTTYKNIKNTSRSEYILNSSNKDSLNAIKRLCIIIEMTMEACGFPECELKVKFQKEKDKDIIIQIIGQELDEKNSNIFKITNLLIKWINSTIKFEDLSYEFSLLYSKLLSELSKKAPQGVNSLKFIQFSKLLNIPCRKVANNIYQFGWGRKAKWLDSSFTNETPAISVNLAKDKISCTHFLREAGFPVPESYEIKSNYQAKHIANKIGFPIVIKAGNLEGGVGVYSDIRSLDEVISAIEKVKKISNKIIIEKHIFGKDYRLQVCHDEVYWAIERKGPRVTGDGKRTINELVKIFNANRTIENKSSDTSFSLIQVNKDTDDYLKSNGMNLESIPKIGQEVKLRGANNVTGGGTFIPTLDSVHPDNISLAIEISRYLRLDIAGIDLIIPDISKSWKESECAVCEVNAQPQISGDRHKYILTKLIHDDGRIPTVLILGQLHDSMPYKKLLKKTSSKKINIGFASANSTWINHEQRLENLAGIYQAGLTLVSNPEVDGIFLQMEFNSKTQLIFPVDKVDVIIITNQIAAELEIHENEKWFRSLISLSDNIVSLKQEAEYLTNFINNEKIKVQNYTESKLEIFLEKLFKNATNYTIK